jgi:hypothetical protein
MAIRLASTLGALIAVAGLGAAALGAVGLAQTAAAPGKKIEAKFAGGFRPDACRWPRAARQQQLSGCCQMDLEISADGLMIRGDGVCSDPMFLEPTLRCLAAQEFIPARQNGHAVADQHHLEYEWRATTPPGRDLCNKLKTS